MDTPKDTKAVEKQQQPRLHLSPELIYELILCVSGTNWLARRMLLSSAFIYRIILSSKKTQSWRQRLSVGHFDASFRDLPEEGFYNKRPILPRIHGRISIFDDDLLPNIGNYSYLAEFNTAYVFYAKITIDYQMLAEGLLPTQAVYYDIVTLSFAVHLPPDLLHAILYFTINKLERLLYKAARGELPLVVL
ncbi:hypothetical protein GPALN_013270 [Globodera pallida]|nr:hypothetical protein GPALN_013270 [Globodera pallida]